MNMFKKIRTALAGFTLIEMILAIAIFSAVMLTVVLLFTKLNSAQRVSQAKMDVLNELRFSIGLVGQEIMSGFAFPNGCGSGCNPDASSPFVFASKVRPDVPTKRIEYYLDASSGRVMRGELKTFGPCTFTPLSSIPGCYAPITSAKAKIGQFTFNVANKGKNLQPVVIISISGNIQGEKFQLSSSYSPRLKQDPNATPPTDILIPNINITSPTSAPTYTTSASTITLGGNADDNVGVASVTWANETTGDTGTAATSGTGIAITWTANNIPLQGSGTDNIIFVAASDADGNTGFAQITVTSNAPPPPPPPVTCNGIDCNFNSVTAEVGQQVCGQNQTLYTCLSSGTWDNTGISCAGGICPLPVCGNGTCQDGAGEDSSSCPTDCPLPPFCGDGFCNGGEDFTTCSLDCVAPFCGDGFCNGGEDFTTCSLDCVAPFCGDGFCNGVEDTFSCPSDCPVVPPPPPPPGSFSLSANPQVILVGVTGDAGTPADSQETIITVNDAGYGGMVSFSCQGVPIGSDCHFIPGSVSAGSSSRFYLTVPGNTVKRDYPINIVGSGSGGLSASVTVVLRVLAKGLGEK